MLTLKLMSVDKTVRNVQHPLIGLAKVSHESSIDAYFIDATFEHLLTNSSVHVTN
jgi:hypothetical protein